MHFGEKYFLHGGDLKKLRCKITLFSKKLALFAADFIKNLPKSQKQ